MNEAASAAFLLASATVHLPICPIMAKFAVNQLRLN